MMRRPPRAKNRDRSGLVLSIRAEAAWIRAWIERLEQLTEAHLAAALAPAG